MNIGEKIKELRISKGFSQKDLAQKIDISVVEMNNIETGKTKPKPYTLSKLSDVLDYDYEDFFELMY